MSTEKSHLSFSFDVLGLMEEPHIVNTAKTDNQMNETEGKPRMKIQEDIANHIDKKMSLLMQIVMKHTMNNTKS